MSTLLWNAESPVSAGSGGHRKYRVDSQQQGGVGLLYDSMSSVARVFWMLRSSGEMSTLRRSINEINIYSENPMVRDSRTI